MADLYHLTTSLWLPAPRVEVFAFFADAHNLERITPAFLNFTILTASPIAMRAGAIIDYRLRLRGVPLTWKTEITEWDPPTRFVDVQRSGPYAQWVHEHTFADDDGGTLVRDHVRYRLRGPALAARLVNAWIVAPDTRRIFEHRHTALLRAFDAEERGRPDDVIVTRESR